MKTIDKNEEKLVSHERISIPSLVNEIIFLFNENIPLVIVSIRYDYRFHLSIFGDNCFIGTRPCDTIFYDYIRRFNRFIY